MAKQTILTSIYGAHAENLERTFSSFIGKSEAELHAFVLGESLPERRVAGVTYHLVSPENTFGHPYREVCYRRWEYLDELDADYGLVVDGTDVLCLQRLPPFEKLLRGMSVAGCAEHRGGRYIQGQGYTGSYLNAGVTWWDVRQSKSMREMICARGRARCRVIHDDQMTLNEVVHTCCYDDLALLPSQYNYRAFLDVRRRGWPTVRHLDGVVIYHNGTCIERALALRDRKSRASLRPLRPTSPPRSALAHCMLRVLNRFRPHLAE